MSDLITSDSQKKCLELRRITYVLNVLCTTII